MRGVVVSATGLAAPAPAPTVYAPAPTSASTKAAVGTAAAVGVVGLVVFLVKAAGVYSSGRDVVTAGRHAAGWVRRQRGARPNPTPLLAAGPRVGRRSATGGRTAAFRVQLGRDPYLETVLLLDADRAVLVRHGRRVAAFRPSSYQRAKIRSGIGEILIFTDQL